MAESSSREIMMDFVNCPICFERFNDDTRIPKSLPCLHTFCVECLSGYVAIKLGKTVSCPTCRKNFLIPKGGITNLPTSFMVKNIVQQVSQSDGSRNITMKAKSCGEHPDEKCLYFCYNCNIPLCSDCLLEQRCDKTHTIKKLKEASVVIDEQIKDIDKSVRNMYEEGCQKLELLEESLTSSKECLLKETKVRFDKVIDDANKWYKATNANIDDDYKKCFGKLKETKEKLDLQMFKIAMIDLATLRNEGLIKDVKYSIETVNEAVERFKNSSIWSPDKWSSKLGSLSKEIKLGMGDLSQPETNLPQLNRFPLGGAPLILPLSESRLKPSCDWSLGLSLNEAVVEYSGHNRIEKISLASDSPSVVTRKTLPDGLLDDCRKYVLCDDRVLFRDYDCGPSYILDKHLDVVKTVDEKFGELIGAYSTNQVAYRRNEQLWICDLDRNEITHTLPPPCGKIWGRGLSVCRHPVSNDIAVVDFEQKTLSMHANNHEYGNFHAVTLDFEVRDSYAVFCNSSHIFILSHKPVGVAVYSWKGELVRFMDQKALCAFGEVYLLNIHGGDDTFTVAMKSSGCDTTYFKTYHCL